MVIEKTVLDYLEARRGEFCSGEELSRELGVTRATVWNRVQALRARGYEIASVRNRGYRLAADSDALTLEGIEKLLNADCAGLSVEIVDETGSTNLDLREAAERGASDGRVLIARRQTGGRGRRGRRFFSPESGLYLSMLLRPSETPAAIAIRYTTTAALAVCEAIEATSSKSPRIKWVNDVMIDGLKVCGIMTEAQIGLENGLVEHAVVGVGVNLYRPKEGTPSELRGIAGYVFDETQGWRLNRFAAEFLNRFTRRRLANDAEDDLKEYRRRLLAQGREGDVLFGAKKRRAKIIDVDDEYRLIVEYPDGTREALSSGEISVRPDGKRE